jgi:hypothetical protein
LAAWLGLSHEPFGQIAAVHVFHGQVGNALVLSDLVDLSNVRVLQASSRLCLRPKTS